MIANKIINPFADHLNAWLVYLDRLLNNMGNDDLGSKVKYTRQMKAIFNTLCCVTANPVLLQKIMSLYNSQSELLIDNAKARSENSIGHSIELITLSTDGSVCAIAVEKALVADDLCLVQGPPGTGKTTVIAEIVLHLLKRNDESRILIVSESQVAVDNALERTLEYSDTEHSLLRYPAHKTWKTENVNLSLKNLVSNYHEYLDDIDKELSAEILKTLELDNIIEIDESLYEEEISPKNRYIHKLITENVNVLGITANHLARFRFDIKDPVWDVVIIDEVSKATLPEILIPLNRAQKLILVGDPKQLPPTFCKEELEIAEEMGETIQELLESNSLIDKLFENADSSRKTLLDVQYRMTNEIGAIVSECFYENKVKNGRNVSISDSVQWLDYETPRMFPSKPVNLGGVLSNEIEAIIIRDKLHELESILPLDSKIAIITPYKAQKRLLRKFLRESPFSPEIDTIDAFQGREARCVFISFTRNNGSSRFYADPRRLNVAISRAQDYLFLVGSSEYLKKVPTIKHFIEVSSNNRKVMVVE